MNTIKITNHDKESNSEEFEIKDAIERADDLAYVKKFAKLLDSQFRIPGTNITFGLDPIIGMFPVVGDIVGYGFSAVLIYSAFKKGVKGEVLVKMLGNMGLDALIGAIPVVGTLFDFAYKANNRNYKLLTEFVEEDKHSGSAWPFILAFLAVTFIVVACLIYGMVSFFSWVVGMF